MTNTTDPDKFTDVNEAVGADWEAETTPYERVREVISRAYTPVSADAVAETARTSPKTARKHLTTLAEEGVVTTGTGENGATTYRRSSESLVVEQAADIREHMSRDELVARVSELRERISDFQAEYGVESPAELLIDRTNQTLAEAATDTDDLDHETIQAWQTTRRNLAFANAALAIANAEQFVDDKADTADESVPPSNRWAAISEIARERLREKLREGLSDEEKIILHQRYKRGDISEDVAKILLEDAIAEIEREQEAVNEASDLDTTGVYQK